MTPVRADDGEEVELMNSGGGGGGGSGSGSGGENPEEEMLGGEEELPSAMAAAQHGITVKENGNSKTEEVSESGSGSGKEKEKEKSLENLDNIIGLEKKKNKKDVDILVALISPRPGEKGAAPNDEGKVAEEVKEEEEGKTSA